MIFYLLFNWYGFSVVCYAVKLLIFAVKLDELTTLMFGYRAGLFVFTGTLYGVLLRVFLEYFSLPCGVPRAMKHACFSPVLLLLGWPE